MGPAAFAPSTAPRSPRTELPLSSPGFSTPFPAETSPASSSPPPIPHSPARVAGTSVCGQLVFGPRASVERCDGAAGPVRPPRADPDVRAHGTAGALTACSTCGQKVAARTPPPRTPGAGPNRYPRSQVNKRQLSRLCVCVWGGAGGGRGAGMELRGCLPSPNLQTEISKGVPARLVWTQHCGKRIHRDPGGGRDLFGASSKDSPARERHGGPGARRGPEVDALTCSSDSPLRRQGGVPRFPPRPAQLLDPIVSGSRLLATGLAAPLAPPSSR